MNDGSVRNFWIPTGATNYRDPLSENIKRAIRQINDNKDNQIAASNQKAEVDPGVQALNTINMSMKAITAGKQAFDKVKAGGKAKKDKKQKEKNELINFLANTPDAKEVVKETVKFHAGAESIFKKDKDFKKQLEAALPNNKELVDLLSDQSAGSLLTTQTWQVNQSVATSYARFDDSITNTDSKEYGILQDKYKGDTAAYYRDWLIDDIGKLHGPNDKPSLPVIAALVHPEATRATSTKKGIDNIAYRATAATKKSEKFVQGFTNAVKLNSDPNKPEGAVNLVSLFMQSQYEDIYATAAADYPDFDPNNEEHRAAVHRTAKNRLTGLVVGSAYRLELDHDQLENLRGGFITHPAGDSAELLLNPNDWKLIDSNITAGREAIIRENDAKAAAYGQKELATYLSDPDKYEGDLDQVAVNLIDMGLSPDNALVKKLQNMNLQTQNADSYKFQRDAHYETFLTADSKTRQDMLDNTITNDKLNDELSKLKTQLETINKNNLLKDDFFLEESLSMIQGKIGNGKTLSTGTKLKAGSQRTMQGIIQRKFHEIHTKNSLLAISEGRENDKTIAEGSRKELNDWLTGHGFGLDTNNPNAGRFSHDSKGEFLGADIQSEVDRETKGYNVDESLHEVNTLFGKYENKQQVVDSGEGVNTAELISFAETGFKVYPKDIILKAEIMGIDPSELVQGKINALLDSKDPADQLFIKAYKLNKNLEIPKAGIDVRGFLEKAYKGSDRMDLIRKDPQNLLYALEYGGFTTKQYERIVALEKNINNFEGEPKTKEERAELELKATNIIKNNQAKKEANKSSEGTQSYFRDTESDLTIEEKDDRYTGF